MRCLQGLFYLALIISLIGHCSSSDVKPSLTLCLKEALQLDHAALQQAITECLLTASMEQIVRTLRVLYKERETFNNEAWEELSLQIFVEERSGWDACELLETMDELPKAWIRGLLGVILEKNDFRREEDEEVRGISVIDLTSDEQDDTRSAESDVIIVGDSFSSKITVGRAEGTLGDPIELSKGADGSELEILDVKLRLGRSFQRNPTDEIVDIEGQARRLLRQLKGLKPDNRITLSIGDYVESVTVEWMQRLLCGGYLNDAIIQGYMRLITAGQDKFIPIDSQLPCTFNSKMPPLTLNRTYLWPVNHKSMGHWTLLIIKVAMDGSVVVTQYDSIKSNKERQGISRIQEIFQDWLNARQIINSAPTPQQTNGVDCGVFVLEIARRIVRGMKIDANESYDTVFLRRRIVVELALGEFIPMAISN